MLSTSTAAWQRHDDTDDEDDAEETVESLLQELEQSSDDEDYMSDYSDDDYEDEEEDESESESEPESDLDEQDYEHLKAFRELGYQLQVDFQGEVRAKMQATGEKRSKVIMDMMDTPLTEQQEEEWEEELVGMLKQALREKHVEANGVEPSDEELQRLVEEEQAMIKAEVEAEAVAAHQELQLLDSDVSAQFETIPKWEDFRQALRQECREAMQAESEANDGPEPSDEEVEEKLEEELTKIKELTEERLKEVEAELEEEEALAKAEFAAKLEAEDDYAEELNNMSVEKVEARHEAYEQWVNDSLLEQAEEFVDEWLLMKDQQRTDEYAERQWARREAKAGRWVTDEEGHSGDELVSVNMGEVEDVEEGAEGDEEGYSGDELMRHSGDEEHSEEEYNEESTEEESTEEEEEEEEDYPLRCNGPHHTTEVPMGNLDVAAKRLSRVMWTDGLKDSDRKPFHLRKAVQKVLDKEDLYRKHAKRKVKRKIKWLEERRNKGF